MNATSAAVVRFSVEVITLPVSDVERALRFYVDKVGFTLDVDMSHSASCNSPRRDRPARYRSARD
jgi:predicted enzyme related to lactoylglutathione lyase